jgi:hypothetical protein
MAEGPANKPNGLTFEEMKEAFKKTRAERIASGAAQEPFSDPRLLEPMYQNLFKELGRKPTFEEMMDV